MHTVREARDLIGREEVELADTVLPGLAIRIRKSGATWCLRGRLGPKQSTWTLGGTESISVSVARERGTEAKKLLKRGVDPKEWLHEQAIGGPVVRHFDPAKDGLTWEQGVDRFLEWVARERRPATHSDYRKRLLSPDCARLKGRLLKSLTDDDFRQVRDEVDRRSPTAAAGLMRVARSCLTWLADSAGSGIKISPAAILRVRSRIAEDADRTEDGAGPRLPDTEELGQLAWQLAKAPQPSGRLAAMLMVLTAQRVRTVYSARVQDFEQTEGGGLWTIPRAFMKARQGKGGRPHVVPLPALAWHVVSQALAATPEGSEWLFPELRQWRAGRPGIGHISRKPVANALLTDGGRVSPHDIRRAFATYGEREPSMRWSRAETKMVLDHAQGLSGDVTSEHYALHDGTHITWGTMRKWESWLVEQFREQAPDGSKALPRFLHLPDS